MFWHKHKDKVDELEKKLTTAEQSIKEQGSKIERLEVAVHSHRHALTGEGVLDTEYIR
jgi:hypothetical protein